MSNEALVLESGTFNSGISDHLPVYVLMKLKIPNSSVRMKCYKNYVPSVFSSDFATKSDDLLPIFSETNVNEITDDLKKS